MSLREIGKFVSGIAANQVITHGAMALDGTRFSLIGIDYTPELNMLAFAFWAVVLAATVYYSWIRRPSDADKR